MLIVQIPRLEENDDQGAKLGFFVDFVNWVRWHRFEHRMSRTRRDEELKQTFRRRLKKLNMTNEAVDLSLTTNAVRSRLRCGDRWFYASLMSTTAVMAFLTYLMKTYLIDSRPVSLGCENVG